MRLDETMGEQVQTQIGVVCVDGRLRQVGDGGADRDLVDVPCLVGARQQREVGRDVLALEPRRPGFGVFAQRRAREPGVEDGAVRRDVRDAYC